MGHYKLRRNKLTLLINTTYTDSEEAGCTGKEDLIEGWCTFNIPLKFYKPLVMFYGRDNFKFDWTVMEECIEEQLETYESNNADEYIYFVHFLQQTHEGVYNLDVATDNSLWPVHDFFHAKFDFYDKQFNCTAEDELIRVRQAYKFLQRNGETVSKDYLNNWVDKFNSRNWGCDYQHSRKGIRRSDVTSFKRINEIRL